MIVTSMAADRVPAAMAASLPYLDSGAFAQFNAPSEKVEELVFAPRRPYEVHERLAALGCRRGTPAR